MSRVIILPRFTVIFTGFFYGPRVRRQFATTDASAVCASTNELARWTTRHISHNVDIIILINFTLFFFLIVNRPWLYRAHYAFSSVCGTRSSERVIRYGVRVCTCIKCVKWARVMCCVLSSSFFLPTVVRFYGASLTSSLRFG